VSSTEQIQTSRDKSIIQKIGFKEFSAICDEYRAVEKATRKLLELAKEDDTPVRVKVDIYKWIVEMNIGKPRQMNNITIGKNEKPLSAGIFTDYSDPDEEPEDKKLRLVYISQDKAMFKLIEKAGGLENVIDALREKGYENIPNIDAFDEGNFAEEAES
jgi:hypothetical protein